MAKKVVLALGAAGVLFSGYLSGVKFFSARCAFGEGCPLFLGKPACYFGFALFLLIFISAAFWVFSRHERMARYGAFVFSLLGTLFAGRFTVAELPLLFDRGFKAYALGLPTCALGLIFFAAVLFITVGAWPASEPKRS